MQRVQPRCNCGNANRSARQAEAVLKAEHSPGHSLYVTERSNAEARRKPVGHEDLNDNWVGAGHLKVGDKIKKADGTTGVVKYVNTVAETRMMYNLDVAVADTFFVGTQGWLVHNCDPLDLAKNAATRGLPAPYEMQGFIPLPKPGVKTATVGKALGWGTGPADALARINDVAMLPDSYFRGLIDQGMDARYIRALGDAYRTAAAAGRGGDTAPIRAKLMDAILSRMNESRR